MAERQRCNFIVKIHSRVLYFIVELIIAMAANDNVVDALKVLKDEEMMQRLEIQSQITELNRNASRQEVRGSKSMSSEWLEFA